MKKAVRLLRLKVMATATAKAEQTAVVEATRVSGPRVPPASHVTHALISETTP